MRDSIIGEDAVRALDPTEVHVVTDHGFILLDEEKLPPEVRCDKDWCYRCRADIRAS